MTARDTRDSRDPRDARTAEKKRRHPLAGRIRQTVRTGAAAVLLLSGFALTAVAVTAARLPGDFYTDSPDGFTLPAVTGVSLKRESAALETADLTGERTYTVCLFGAVPVEQVTVRKEERLTVVPSGETFGIRLYSDGVMVVGLAQVDGPDGPVSPAYEAGLRAGDIITAVDGVPVRENSEVNRAVTQSEGQGLKLTFTRDGRTYTAELCPVRTQTGYKAGMWVRDSVAGIGTLTYFDRERSTFAGLGHGVTDADSGGLYPIASGGAVEAHITSVVKGECGRPGELKGYFEDAVVGDLFANTETGVFGLLADTVGTVGTVDTVGTGGEALPVAFRQEVQKGRVTILCEVNERGVEAYEAEIEEIRYTPSRKTRNMVLHITDPRLLEQTGGIVQGMSGSPILQNGRIVGAVTHVFVDDPTRGYAVFAENMLDTEDYLLQSAANGQIKEAG